MYAVDDEDGCIYNLNEMNAIMFHFIKFHPVQLNSFCIAHISFIFPSRFSYVFSAPDQLLESMPGTLMLTDCLEACQANESCGAVNYETGLCVLFSSNADKLPGMLSSSKMINMAMCDTNKHTNAHIYVHF